jgi:deoxycytidine triphosphate deaminase
MRVGRNVLKSLREKEGTPIIDMEKERVLHIGTGEFVEIMTLEKVQMPPNICARIGIRSYFTRKELIPFAGPQIDPGFRGHLIISVFNTGPRPIIMKYGEPFCTIEFHELSDRCEKPYSGEYQDQNDFPSDNIEFIIGAKGITLYEVVEVMRGLRSDVRWMKVLLLLILGALIAGIIGRFFP